ncbi:MAG: hypothetical protein Q6373_021975 [Candidatus Sigynarchaeota archaeon]
MSTPDLDIDSTPTRGKKKRYWEDCIVCGGKCKAYGDYRDQARCAGCYQPFHVGRCGLPHACNKCIATLPAETRETFTKKQRSMARLYNVMAYICIFPIAMSMAIGYFGRFFPALLVGLGFVGIMVAVFVPISGKLRRSAFAAFDAHPVPGVARRKERTIECPSCKQPTKASDGFLCMRCSIKVCPHCNWGNKGVLATVCDNCHKPI